MRASFPFNGYQSQRVAQLITRYRNDTHVIIERYVTDTNVIKATVGLAASLMLVAGVFQVGPPKWSGASNAVPQHVDAQAVTSPVTAPVTAPAPPTPDQQQGYADPQAIAALQPPKIEGPAMPATAPRQDPARDAAATGDVESGVAQSGAAQSGVAQWAHPQSPSAAETKAASTQLLVARQFAKVIPAGHADLSTAEQKAQFIEMLLPLILASNEEIMQRRVAIQQAADRDDRPVLERWARLYRVSTKGVSSDKLVAQILQRANIVPVPIALAQSAVESGWGTSRFATQGNALFGQWAWNPDAGMKPLDASNSRAVVRSFPNLFGSVRGYMHNLNTHPRYQEFRAQRQKYMRRSEADLANILVKQLDGYAEIGYAYVEKIELIIRSNDFNQFANARLR